MTLNLLLVLLNDCVIIHIRDLHCKVLCFYDTRLQTFWFEASLPGVRKTSSQSALEKIISQDHRGHKERGQPSQRDWMSPRMLRQWPTSRTSLFVTLYICHQISLQPISSNWPHSMEAPETMWLRSDGVQSLYNTFENTCRDDIFVLCFTHIYLAEYLKKNKSTIWLCIKDWWGMLVRAPEPNDKVEGVEKVSVACVEEQRLRLRLPRPLWSVLEDHLSHHGDTHLTTMLCFVRSWVGVRRQTWFTWTGGFQERERARDEIWYPYLRGKTMESRKRTRWWCGVSVFA